MATAGPGALPKRNPSRKTKARVRPTQTSGLLIPLPWQIIAYLFGGGCPSGRIAINNNYGGMKMKTKSTKTGSVLAFLSVMLFLLLALRPGGAKAAVFDIVNGDVTGLITAIDNANTNPGPDTINLAAGGTYTLTVADNLDNGLPIVTSKITINGNGSVIERSSATGTSEFRIFGINSGDLTLNEATITRGRTPLNGGGIFNNFGFLTLTNSTVSGSASSNGGGIFNNFGVLTLTNSMISGNTSSSTQTTLNGGGGIHNTGTLTLTNSTVRGNTSTATSGGIHALSGTLILIDSTVSDNTGAFVGGIYNRGGSLTMTNSTVSGNTGGGSGGIYDHEGTVILTNSTVSGNIAISLSDGVGGVDNRGNMILTHSTVSGNTATAAFGVAGIRNSGIVTLGHTIIDNDIDSLQKNCSGAATSFASFGYNVVSDTSCHLNGTGDIIVSSRVGPLADNGGPTQTHALLSGSPAIDAIPLADCKDSFLNDITTDQRGVTRHQGSACDIGAVEMCATGACTTPIPTPTPTPTPTPIPIPTPTPTPTPAQTPTGLDVDGDGIPNTTDPDIDGDNILNATDPDIDGDGVANTLDDDPDGNGIPSCQGKKATLWGNGENNFLTGTAGPDVIHGLGGNDTIRGGGGNDLICGGAGNDKLFGQNGKDKLYGQAGKDKLDGGKGKDFCHGGSGKDTAKTCEKRKGIP